MRGLLRSYRRMLETDRQQLIEDFKFVHMARKVVGVGSVGTRASILLLLGWDGQDPLFLRAKEAEESVMERFVGKSQYQNHGQRVSCVWKGSAEVETMNTSAMTAYSRMCGATLARAHARSGDRIAIAATWAKRRIRPGHGGGRPPSSPPRTPTRTSATTKPSSTQSISGRTAEFSNRFCELCGYIRRGATG